MPRAAIARRKRLNHGLSKRVCTSHTSITRSQALIYRHRLNAVLGDDQARGEYLGGSRLHAGDNGHSLQLVYQDSNEKRVIGALCRRAVIEVILLS